jgi:hypothetical protein
MRLRTLYIRFYRSFNFDYLRKSRDDARPDPWDSLGEDKKFFPFVRIPLEPDVTTVVGANEAGKSQLLYAIEALLTGEGVEKKDFCRYSTEFNEEDAPELPEFGGEFTDLSDEDRTALAGLIDLAGVDSESFHLFRFHDRIELFVGNESWVLDGLPDDLVLPKSFRIDARIPLPDSVEISFLAGEENAKTRTRQSWLSRMLFVREHPESLENPTTGAARPVYGGADDSPDAELLEQWELARRLLVEVAGITESEFAELSKAVHTSEGYAEALVDKMNRKLADSLNFKHWWTQDTDFALRLRLRDFDLVFTIRDRTGSDYTFRERSQGLKYFLSYFVQYLSHDPAEGEMLLMDEPDAFLSNSGQQDLLRIFAAFAHPENDDRDPVQVVYVTHSPFLIDKNHAERIRVLEKGDGEEGTRVVKNAGRNHYEPLRTALGGFVAETTFISSCNLMVEGQADPILLAGASGVARKVAPNGNALDLNTLTLVPCGGAGNVPYMVYLARGRDEDKPAVLVLVDNDADGQKAMDGIKAMKGLLPDSLLFTVAATVDGQDRAEVVELEDLIPAALANAAVKRLARTVLPHKDAEAFVKAWKDVKPSDGDKSFKLLAAAAADASSTAGLDKPFELDKVPFARNVMDLALDESATAKTQKDLYDRFQPILAVIEQKQREALRDHAHAKISTILKRLRKNFVTDHPNAIRKNEATALLESIEAQLPRDAVEADSVMDGIRRLGRDFKLADEPRSLIEDPQAFRDALATLVYGVTNAVQQAP